MGSLWWIERWPSFRARQTGIGQIELFLEKQQIHSYNQNISMAVRSYITISTFLFFIAVSSGLFLKAFAPVVFGTGDSSLVRRSPGAAPCPMITGNGVSAFVMSPYGTSPP